MTDLDSRTNVVVPDECVSEILTKLFDKFNFTVMESTPFDIEVAVDPEMLGKVFEELVTGRHDTGSYYTPRPVVAFMCREALKGYLEGCGNRPCSRGHRQVRGRAGHLRRRAGVRAARLPRRWRTSPWSTRRAAPAPTCWG